MPNIDIRAQKALLGGYPCCYGARPLWLWRAVRAGRGCVGRELGRLEGLRLGAWKGVGLRWGGRWEVGGECHVHCAGYRALVCVGRVCVGGWGGAAEH